MHGSVSFRPIAVHIQDEILLEPNSVTDMHSNRKLEFNSVPNFRHNDDVLARPAKTPQSEHGGLKEEGSVLLYATDD